MGKFQFFFLLLFLTTLKVQAQTDSVVQLSGIISTNEGEQLLPVPYCGVYSKTTKEGIYSNENGFFSIVTTLSDTIILSHINYERLEIAMSDLVFEDQKKTILVELTEMPELLPEVVIYPWPSKEFFEIEFVNMKLNDSLHHIAQKHLEREVIQELVLSYEADPEEHGKILLRKTAAQNYTIGQDPYYAIFDAIAWGKFINQLSKGKIFGKKEKEEDKPIRDY